MREEVGKRLQLQDEQKPGHSPWVPHLGAEQQRHPKMGKALETILHGGVKRPDATARVPGLDVVLGRHHVNGGKRPRNGSGLERVVVNSCSRGQLQAWVRTAVANEPEQKQLRGIA